MAELLCRPLLLSAEEGRWIRGYRLDVRVTAIANARGAFLACVARPVAYVLQAARDRDANVPDTPLGDSSSLG